MFASLQASNWRIHRWNSPSENLSGVAACRCMTLTRCPSSAFGFRGTFGFGGGAFVFGGAFATPTFCPPPAFWPSPFACAFGCSFCLPPPSLFAGAFGCAFCPPSMIFHRSRRRRGFEFHSCRQFNVVASSRIDRRRFVVVVRFTRSARSRIRLRFY